MKVILSFKKKQSRHTPGNKRAIGTEFIACINFRVSNNIPRILLLFLDTVFENCACEVELRQSDVWLQVEC